MGKNELTSVDKPTAVNTPAFDTIVTPGLITAFDTPDKSPLLADSPVFADVFETPVNITKTAKRSQTAITSRQSLCCPLVIFTTTMVKLTRQSLPLVLLVLFATSHAFLLAPENKSSGRRTVPLFASLVESMPPTGGALDPSSETAQRIILDELACSTEQYDKLVALSYLVTDWNERINLVSRKDCNPSTVFGRHILPCVALKAVGHNNNPLATTEKKLRIVDVGTGGGFPGLPLSIIFPQHEYVLLDSVGKKLVAVADMAEQLELNHVTTHHGRAEDLVSGPKFHIATGRSVSDLMQFCAWMQHLLRRDDDYPSQLMYWSGGAMPDAITLRCSRDFSLHELIPKYCDFRSTDDPHGKRILMLPWSSVQTLAHESGVKVIPQKQASHKKKTVRNNKKTSTSPPPRRKAARGAWRSRTAKNDEQEAAPKQRGYEGFQRYSSAKQWNPASSNDE